MKISINKSALILSLISSIVFDAFLIKKNKEERKRILVASIIIPVLIIFSSIFVSGKIYDQSCDGNYYHKVTIGKLVNGWNPLYEKVEDFNKKGNDVVESSIANIWVNHYARGSHVFAANVVSVTNNIETGKSINIISVAALFLLFMAFILYETKDLLMSTVFGIVVASCTTITSQILTNYVDILVYVYFFLIILSFFMFEKLNLFKHKNNYLILFFLALTIGINIKFSLFAYDGIFCLGYYIWYIVRLKKKQLDKQFFKRFTIVSIVSLIIGVFVIGLSVYPKNFIEKGHPFYPIMGKDKVDIMTNNQPYYFGKKSTLEKFYIATFSKAENIIRISKSEATLKMPFTIYPEEFYNLSVSDLRMSGNGILFSGILVLSVILFAIYIFKIYKKDKKLFYLIIIPTVITILLIIFLDESWWARYFPQLHLIVFFALAILLYNKSKTSIGLLYILLTIILLNNYITLNASLNSSINYTRSVNTQYYYFDISDKKKQCTLSLYSDGLDGAFYNIIEKENKNKVVVSTKKEYESHKEEYNDFMGGYVKWRCK